MSLQQIAILALIWASPQAEPGCPTLPDGDLDGLSDACELELAARFAPVLIASATACNWDLATARLAGGYLFGAHPIADGIRLVYLPAYLADCGWSGAKCLLRWRGGCDPHAGDSEFVAIDLHPDSTGAGWRPERVFLSAHCFGNSDGDCRWHAAGELQWLAEAPFVWVAEGKNANYPSESACDAGHWGFDTCDRNDRSFRFPVELVTQNVGSALAPFPAHSEEPSCVLAAELPHAPPRPGRECIWVDPAFRGWAGIEVDGATGYRRYLEEVAEIPFDGPRPSR